MDEAIMLTNSGESSQSPGNSILSSLTFESQEFQKKNKRRFYVLEIVSFAFFLVILALAATLAVEKQKSPTEHTPCPDDWIGYLRKCFYFSDHTATWDASQSFCASHTATLAVFNTTEEMDFLKRYADHSQYWIGLTRGQGAEWHWTGGTLYSSGVKITGRGQYAYLHKNGISSASSHLFKKWICSKQDTYPPKS